MIWAIILCKDEEIHLQRCISSIKTLVDHVLIIDSFSTDRTTDIANKNNCTVLSNSWVNYSTQFQFGLDYVRKKGIDWVLRIDADEYVLEKTVDLTRNTLAEVRGYNVDRYYCWNGKIIRYGGASPQKALRMFSVNDGGIESRWMDEHIFVDGPVEDLDIIVVDDNKKGFSFWYAKHKVYAVREAIDYYSIVSSVSETTSRAKLKIMLYNKSPLFVRVILYWIYRFFFRGGFLDGYNGMSYHFWHALWYRGIVDFEIVRAFLSGGFNKDGAKRYLLNRLRS